MEVTNPILHEIVDTTTTVGVIYFGSAPIDASEDDAVWTISRVSLTSPYDINYGRSNIGGNLEKKLKTKWADRTSLTY